MAMTNRSPKDSRNEQIIELLGSGEVPKVIAMRFHITVSGVYKIRKRFHVEHVRICPKCLLCKKPIIH
jgi:DNA-binding CsgD family transcriptional regulator